MLLTSSDDGVLNLIFDFVNRSVEEAEQLITDEVMGRAPVDTTALRESLEVQSFVNGESIVIRIQTDDQQTSEYGLFQDVGTSSFDGNVGWFSNTDFSALLEQAFD